MAPAVHLTDIETITHELSRLHEAISRRASLLNDQDRSSNVVDNWLAAERQMIQRPPIEVRERDGRVEILAGLPGVEADDVLIRVAAEDLVVEAEPRPTPFGRASAPEAPPTKILGAVHFPHPIDPETLRVEYEDGLLRLTASVRHVFPRRTESASHASSRARAAGTIKTDSETHG